MREFKGGWGDTAKREKPTKRVYICNDGDTEAEDAKKEKKQQPLEPIIFF
jgi:hypothetical protein